jgi:hypothetical protein
VTKLNRWPGEYHRPPAPQVELSPDDFDQTITGADLDATVRNLKVLRERTHSSEEEARYQFKAIEDLTTASKEHARSLEKVVAALKLKQSKAASIDFQNELAANINRRLDGIYKLIAALGVLFAIILAVIGWSRH